MCHSRPLLQCQGAAGYDSLCWSMYFQPSHPLNIGKVLASAQPIELCIGNIVRRVLYIVRHEFTVLQTNKNKNPNQQQSNVDLSLSLRDRLLDTKGTGFESCKHVNCNEQGEKTKRLLSVGVQPILGSCLETFTLSSPGGRGDHPAFITFTCRMMPLGVT